MDDYLDKGVSDEMFLVTDNEWELLANDQMSPEMFAKKKHEKWYKKMAKKLKLKMPKSKDKEKAEADSTIS